MKRRMVQWRNSGNAVNLYLADLADSYGRRFSKFNNSSEFPETARSEFSQYPSGQYPSGQYPSARCRSSTVETLDTVPEFFFSHTENSLLYDSETFRNNPENPENHENPLLNGPETFRNNPGNPLLYDPEKFRNPENPENSLLYDSENFRNNHEIFRNDKKKAEADISLLNFCDKQESEV